MALEVAYENPDFPKDFEFDIGVGVPIPNGGKATLDEFAEARFLSEKGVSIKDYFKDSESVKVTGTTDLKGEAKAAAKAAAEAVPTNEPEPEPEDGEQ